MRQNTLVVAVSIGLAAAALTARADVTLGVVPSSAPNAFGSPSWGGYTANAVFGLENGLAEVGDRETDPAGYTAITNGLYEPGDIMVTSFNSWRGLADPGTSWGPAFASELGNRMHFGLHAMGDGLAQFHLADVTYDITSTDGVLNFSGDLSGLDYAAHRIGIDWGPDRQRGTADDVRYSSGNGGALIDELVYVGVGNAYWPQPDGGQSEQEAIDEVVDWITTHDVLVTGSYSILASDGNTYSSAATIALVPAPAGLALLAAAAVSAARRRRS